jgi:predicted ferric reductase
MIFWPAFILTLGSLAVIGAVFACVGLFITRANERSHESHADRAYRWREQMREMSRR